MTSMDIAWAAGIIEGEGCIVVGKGKNRQVRLAVEMCDLDILERLKCLLGPHAHLNERKPYAPNPKHRVRYILTLCGSALFGWLMTIYSFMGKRRREKIQEAFDILKVTRSFHYHTPRKRWSTWIGQQLTLPFVRHSTKRFAGKGN